MAVVQRRAQIVSIGRSDAYTLGIWDRLTRFVDDARIPLDNNATERAIRGPVVGRKNHYGSKSRRGTEVASTLYTILETCKLNAVDHRRILRPRSWRLIETKCFCRGASRPTRSNPPAVTRSLSHDGRRRRGLTIERRRLRGKPRYMAAEQTLIRPARDADHHVAVRR